MPCHAPRTVAHRRRTFISPRLQQAACGLVIGFLLVAIAIDILSVLIHTFVRVLAHIVVIGGNGPVGRVVEQRQVLGLQAARARPVPVGFRSAGAAHVGRAPGVIQRAGRAWGLPVRPGHVQQAAGAAQAAVQHPCGLAGAGLRRRRRDSAPLRSNSVQAS